MLSRNMTTNVHQWLAAHIAAQQKEQLIAVDGTLGNGFDLEFLNAQKKIHTIYGFDIQEEAVAICSGKIKESTKNIRLIQDSHDLVDVYIQEPIDIAMFNLGYLPGGDKSIVTQVHSSLSAIEKTISQLADEGMMVVMTYPGHPEGEKEHQAIKDYLQSLHKKELSILEIGVQNVKKPCPHAFLIIKK
ncbi:MAG: tRNA (mnm(5)s(2)U34)-methyltransferase [Cellulosilyticaceae bacterium]